MCGHAPMFCRKETEEGVRLLTRLENWLESRFHFRALEISWLSTSATLSLDVMGDDPVR